jgi:hypothetical protein
MIAACLLSIAASAAAKAPLKAPDQFQQIANREERSRALFNEATRVLFHPRCVNCHPNGDSPLQGDEHRVHDPAVVRGASDRGVPGMQCAACHQDKNLELARVPGAPEWHLAPRQMFWMGRTAASLCAQLKDKSRNGGKTLEQIVEHSGHDPLVGWGWNPGWQRTPAPGTQEQFGALMAAWVRDGAACPKETGKK